jgi:hypothetical protein
MFYTVNINLNSTNVLIINVLLIIISNEFIPYHLIIPKITTQ